MTKQQLRCIKILTKNNELTSEELFKEMRLELQFDTSSCYGMLISELSYPDDECFEKMITVSHMNQEYDPLCSDTRKL